MSYARAARRRASRQRQGSGASGTSAWTLPDSGPPHGGVIGTLDDGRAWVVRFPTTEEAGRFLSILGPPPASEERLRAALKVMGRGLHHG
jgi:hypothetical protein